jgi:hypothetical protein
MSWVQLPPRACQTAVGRRDAEATLALGTDVGANECGADRRPEAKADECGGEEQRMPTVWVTDGQRTLYLLGHAFPLDELHCV